jgi:hypothetical protein
MKVPLGPYTEMARWIEEVFINLDPEDRKQLLVLGPPPDLAYKAVEWWEEGITREEAIERVRQYVADHPILN